MAPLQAGTAVCTLGMHRSGTSLVSRLLNILGVHLGPPQSISGGGADNPRGYWEHYSLVLLNDEILARFGGLWDAPPPFPPSWSRNPDLEDLRVKARQLLTEDFAAHPLWGWKDPRTCLTIPFWQELIASMRYVVCLRNPGAVVASLTSRNGMTAAKAELLWLAHVQASLAHTSGKPRMFVFYEDVINDWAPELQRMAAFIERPEGAEDPRVHASVDAFLENALCHHRMSMDDLARNEQISSTTKGLYLALKDHARRDPAPDDEVLALAARSHELTFREKQLRRSMAVIESDLRGEILSLSVKERELASRNQSLRESMAILESGLRAEVLELSTRGHDLEFRERHSRRSMVTLESNLRRVTDERDAQARQNEACLQALQNIHASFGWRLVTFWRQMVAGVMPDGSRRRRAFDAVLRRVTPGAPVNLGTD
jgi:hypothetical protein